MSDWLIVNALVTLVKEGDTISIMIVSPENKANRVRLVCSEYGGVDCEDRTTDYGSHMRAFEVLTEFMERG